MKTKLVSEREDAEIIKDMEDIFDVKNMRPAIGEFVDDSYNIIHVLETLEQRCAENGQDQDLKNKLYHELLIFAESMLEKLFHFYPIAGIITGYVAAQDFSKKHTDQIKGIFAQIEHDFYMYREAPGIRLFELETYYCAARMVPFETVFSALLHLKADRAIRDIFDISPESYIGFFMTSVSHADKQVRQCPSEKALLLFSLKSIMLDKVADPKAENLSKAETVNRLTDAANFSFRIGVALSDHSPFAHHLATWFSGAWRAINRLDSEQGKVLLKLYARACDDGGPTNKEFALAIKEKVDAIFGSETHDRPLRPESKRAGQLTALASPPLVQPPVASPG